MGEVYIDILILENIFMNFFLLYLLSKISKNPTNNIKIFIASFIGSMYIIVVFIPSLHIFYSLIFKVIVSVLMVYIAFIPKDIKKLLRLILIFYTEAFILGGGIIGFFYLVYGDINSIDSVFLLSKISTKFIIISSFIAILFIKIGFDIFESYYSEKQCEVNLEIYLNGKSCNIKGFIDTGNQLRDPLDGSKVIVSNINALSNLINIKDNNINSLKENTSFKIRTIPYKAIGTENGVLIGFKSDIVIAKNKNKTKINKNITIALNNKSFLGDSSYDAIVYPEILS